MELREDRKNFPKAHILFKASNFQTADDWHYREEINGWDPRVVVSFQENVWVYTSTHLHGLAEVMGPINDHLGEVKMQGVQIEDNLYVHQVDKMMDFWSDVLGHFELPLFVPKNMTEIIQFVDRHIGI